MPDLGRMLVGAGLVLIAIGIIVMVAGKIPGVGKLPGDIFIKKENFSFYFPLTSCILLSVIASLIMFLFNRR